ncbi:MAG: 1,4-dihydroxy-2-naphthoate polyprenyltransferase, partial [Anaerolineae bacterium]|nr:1,4-dihydroxy-2-naphthoate polyprenyltransferase [Anaerolineae bacterium]
YKRQVWALAARPRTLPASIAPVIVGAAVAAYEGAFQLPAVLAALLAALFIQIGSNFANDLGDYYRGADRVGRVGPTRVTSAGLLTPRQVQMGMAVVFGVAALCGLYLIALGGWPILVVGVLAILAALAYTLGPAPFGYYGLGDLAVFIFFGLVAVVGTAYVQTQRLTPLALVAAVPMGCLITNILVVNNLRDIETDRAAGKRTLAVLLGRQGARGEYILLLGIAYATPFVLWRGFGLTPWVLLPLFTLPVAVRLARIILTTEGVALNRALADTARLVIWFAAALAAGIVAQMF